MGGWVGGWVGGWTDLFLVPSSPPPGVVFPRWLFLRRLLLLYLLLLYLLLLYLLLLRGSGQESLHPTCLRCGPREDWIGWVVWVRKGGPNEVLDAIKVGGKKRGRWVGGWVGGWVGEWVGGWVGGRGDSSYRTILPGSMRMSSFKLSTSTSFAARSMVERGGAVDWSRPRRRLKAVRATERAASAESPFPSPPGGWVGG